MRGSVGVVPRRRGGWARTDSHGDARASAMSVLGTVPSSATVFLNGATLLYHQSICDVSEGDIHPSTTTLTFWCAAVLSSTRQSECIVALLTSSIHKRRNVGTVSLVECEILALKGLTQLSIRFELR